MSRGHFYLWLLRNALGHTELMSVEGRGSGCTLAESQSCIYFTFYLFISCFLIFLPSSASSTGACLIPLSITSCKGHFPRLFLLPGFVLDALASLVSPVIN